LISLAFITLSDKKNDCKATQIWTEYHGLMIYTARKILNESAVDDAVSESFIKIIRNLDKILEISSYQTKSYIVNIVRNTSLDILRKSKRNEVENLDDMAETISDVNVDVLGSLVSKEGHEAIKSAIKSLPDQLKDVVFLSLVHGHNHSEIAELLNITEAASKMRLHRAKSEIKKRLEGAGYDKPHG